MRSLAIRVAAALGFAPSVAAPASAQLYEDRFGMWHGGWGWGHMAVGGFLMVLFWAAVIALAVMLVRGLAGGGRRDDLPSRSTALDVLEERFARGEIGREEFEERRGVLLASRAGRR
jgi:putative membrane protein